MAKPFIYSYQIRKATKEKYRYNHDKLNMKFKGKLKQQNKSKHIQ